MVCFLSDRGLVEAIIGFPESTDGLRDEWWADKVGVEEVQRAGECLAAMQREIRIYQHKEDDCEGHYTEID